MDQAVAVFAAAVAAAEAALEQNSAVVEMTTSDTRCRISVARIAIERLFEVAAAGNVVDMVAVAA